MLSNRRKLELLKEVRLREARRSFLSFRQLINPKDKWGWWQIEVAGHLQQFLSDLNAGLRPKLVIEAPPQHGKSVQIIDFIAYMAGVNPDLRAIYTSFSERLGVRANLRLQRIYESKIYKEIFPETRINQSGAGALSGQFLRNREIIEYVDRDGYFRNTTVGGSITGESLDVGVIDDPIKGRKDASSQVVRDGAWNWFTDDFFTRFSEDAGLLCILTRWHIDDPIGRLTEQNPDVKVLKYKAIAEEDEPHRRIGEPLFPEHKSLEFLLERKKIMPAGNWSALYQQTPTVAEGEMIKPDMIAIVDAIPHDAREFVRGWDLAATVDGGDYTAGVKLARLGDGRFIICDVVRCQTGPHERDAVIKNTAARDGVSARQSLPQDPAQAGKTQALYMTNMLAGYSVSFSPETGDKVTRASPLASQINVGNVIMLRGSWNAALIEEMRTFPMGKHDDQVDAASRAFAMMVGSNFGMLDYMQELAKNG